MLTYDANAAAAADGGRVFALHQDDSDFLSPSASALPAAGAARTSCTSSPAAAGGQDADEADASARAVRHTHVAGVGVLHAADAYHRVTPVADGVRHSLVVQAMRDDAEWKRGFLSGEG